MAYVPQDILDRIAALEREVRTLRGRSQMRPALNQVLNGDVVIGEGGRLIAKAPNGNRIFLTGQTPAGDWAVGIARPTDGTPALTVGDEDATGSGQMIRIWNRDPALRDVIVMDDAYSERFLGRPWMPIGLYPTARQSNTSTSYDTAWWGSSPAHNAVAVIVIFTYAGTGGGQVKVSMTPSGGTAQTLAEYDVPATTWVQRTIEAPLDGVEFLQSVVWDVSHRAKTSGQNIETRLYRAYTRNTFTADEAPDTPARTATAATAAPAADIPPATKGA
ncbi:hypothetical protein [Streptomyces shenzhenensis]|uniref:Uncharacterized protein n=1 Tax=Streptomyces shenzhenensis TaxID=943815 RepID=A0A3M0I608_9ACTN|nr:hypothetical protein [Streptomyces shenzhenensis]RMB83640.1 hypothetical protein CTZ28_23265 [Streptomyces shenzhenensis]